MAKYQVEVAIYHMVFVEAESKDEAETKGEALAEAGEGRNGCVEATYCETVDKAEAA